MFPLLLVLCALAAPLLAADLPPAYGKVPLSFAPSPVPGAFTAQGNGYAFSLTAQSAELRLSGGGVRMALAGARPAARLEPLQPLPGVLNWLVGSDPSQWRRGVPTYARLRAAAVLPGVDLVYYGNQQQLEYDLIVAPGADPQTIRWQFAAIDGLRLAADGALLLATPGGELRWRAPEVYQEKAGVRIPIPSAYTLHPGHRAGFRIGAYDKSLPLIIDPTFDYVRHLTQSGRANAVQVDEFGQAFFAGSTPAASANGDNAFVAGLDSNGNTLQFFTVFGPSGETRAHGLALDRRGFSMLYVTGGYQTPNGVDVFLSTFDSRNGDNRFHSTVLLGGSGTDVGLALAPHPTDGSVYIAGVTDSPDLRTLNPLQSTKAAGRDGFLMRVYASGPLLHSTYLGGAGDDSIRAVQLDAAGRIWLAGTSTSQDTFAAPAAHQPRNAGGADCLLTGLNAAGTARIFSSYLGGAADDGCTGLGLTPEGNIVVAGYTDSPDFPTLNPTQATHGGARDMFVAEFGPVAGLQFATFLGGPRLDTAHGIAVDSSGTVHLAGESTGRLPLLNPVAAEKAGSPGVLLRAASPSGSLVPVLEALDPETEITAWTFASATEAFAAGNSGRLYRSLDGGASWRAVSAPAGGIESLASSGNALLAATGGGVSLSLDHGSSWRAMGSGLPAISGRSAVLINPETGGFYLAHSSAGFFRSLNNGVSWAAANSGLANRNILHLAADPQNPSMLYAATAAGVFRSGDSGGSWSLAGGTRVLTQVAPSSETGTLYGVEAGRPVISTDAAKTWAARPLPIGDAVLRLAVDPANPRHVLAATAATGLWRTLDRGASWTLASPADATALDALFAPGGNGVVLAALRNHPDAVVARWGQLRSSPNRYSYYLASVSYFGTHRADAGLAVTADANTVNTYIAGYSAGSPFVTRFGPSPGACAYKTSEVDPFGFTPAAGGAASLQLATASGCAWSATAGAPWLQLHGNGNRTGSGEVRAFTLRNDGAANRETTLTVGGHSIPVRQNGTACDTEARLITDGTNILTLGFGFEVRLEIPTGCHWDTKGPAWINIRPAKGIGPGTIFVSASNYSGPVDRTGDVRIGSRTLPVTQPTFCRFTPTDEAVYFSPLGGSGTVSLVIDSRCPWTLVPPDPAITLTSAASGTGSASATFLLAPNPGPARSFTLGSARIHQDGSQCSYTLGASLLQTTKEPSSLRLSVSTQPTCRRPAVSDQPWLQVAGMQDTGSGDLVLTVSRNTGVAHRTAQVTLGRQTVTIVQGGQPDEIPSLGTPIPIAGSGVSNTFLLSVSDLNGDLNVVNLLIGSSLDARRACYLAYVRSTNTLYLVPDSGEGLLATERTNSQCSVQSYGLRLHLTETGVLLSLPLVFSPQFAGNKVVYAAARDHAGNNTGWRPVGVWNVPGSALTLSDSPQVTSLAPYSIDRGRITLEMTVSDPNGIANLNVLNLLINNGLDARDACYLAYVYPANTVYLVPDSGEGLLPPGVLENRQCRIQPPGVTAIPESGGLRIRVTIDLKSGPSPYRIIYGAVGDLQGNNSGWHAMGTVGVP